MNKVAIVGAGIAGLSAAYSLQDRVEITLFDKSWRAGGRLTTRSKAFEFDHGAQYFTARSTAFQEFLRPLVKTGLIQPWIARHAKIETDRVKSMEHWHADHPRYVAAPGMTELGQMLSMPFNTCFETRITRITRVQKSWRLFSDEKPLGDFDWVILAVPSPQAKAIMPNQFSRLEALNGSEMLACFTLMLGLEEVDLQQVFDGVAPLQRDDQHRH